MSGKGIITAVVIGGTLAISFMLIFIRVIQLSQPYLIKVFQ